MNEFLPFALPDVGEEEIEAVASAIRSGWLSSGPKVKEFEAAFAAALGGDVHAVALNSATAGLHLALEALGIGPGDEVLVPTWTFTATAEVVRHVGAEPVLVDVNPDTLNIDLRHARTLLNRRVRAVMPVHFAGHPIDYRELRDFADENLIHVVEDAAHAFPAASDGVRIGGGSSDATVFSFYATKTMTTGEGGMLTTKREDIAQRARVMRLHGISRDAFDRYRSPTPSWHYEVVAPGYKYNLTDPAAAMGLVQLRRADAMRDRREQIAAIYRAEFAGIPVVLPPLLPTAGMHAWHLFVIRLESGHVRDRLVARLNADGVGTSVHFIPLHMHPFWRERGGYGQQHFPQATSAFERVLSLPIYSSMTDSDVARVVHAVTMAFS